MMWIPEYALYYTSSKVSTVQAIIIDPHNNQVPLALIAQLVAQHYTGITEVRIQVPFTPFFPYCSSAGEGGVFPYMGYTV